MIRGIAVKARVVKEAEEIICTYLVTEALLARPERLLVLRVGYRHIHERIVIVPANWSIKVPMPFTAPAFDLP